MLEAKLVCVLPSSTALTAQEAALALSVTPHIVALQSAGHIGPGEDDREANKGSILADSQLNYRRRFSRFMIPDPLTLG